MALLRPTIWTQQPQVAVAVSHKFGKPAAAAIHTSIAAPDLVGRREATLYGGTYPPESVVGPAGKGLKAVSGGNSIVPAYSIPEITGDYTLICVASIPSTGTWALIDTDAYPSTRHLQFRVESSNAIGAIPFDTGGNPVFPVSAGSVSHGVPFVAAVRLSGSDCDVWLGGIGGTKATLSGSPQHSHGLFTIGASQSGGGDDCVNGGATIYSWVAFPSAISDAALRELTKSVSAYWQIFAPRSSRRLISAGAGGSTAYTLDSQPGSVTVVGSAATLKSARKLSASPGAVSIVGASATLKRSLKLSASAGTVAIAGASASLKVTRKLSANAGAVTIAGATAELVYTAVGASPVLNAESGSIAISGATATLKATRKLSADAGSITIVGASATMVKYFAGLSLNAQPGAVTIAGAVAGFRRTYKFIALPGSVAITGATASMVYTGATGQYTRAPSGAGPTVIQPGSYRPSNTGGRRY